jgi:hemerythrin superfamily protein
MDIVQLIKQDHRKVKGLFRRFEQGNGNGRQRIAEEIIEELSRHAVMEEQLVYPLLRARDEKHDDDVLEALEEHHVAKATLLELDKMSIDDERYEAKMKVLSESIKHHIEEEETRLLPRLTRLTSDGEREQLAEAAVKAKEAAPNHPHPMAPDTPPGNVVAGLLAKVMDAGRDVARSVISPSKGRARAAVKKARSSRATAQSTRAARSSRKRAHG